MTFVRMLRALCCGSLVALSCVVEEDGNQDALPTVLLEAGAAGLPAVATRVAGIPEIVRHRETGLVVPPGDADALARAMALLLIQPRLRASYGRAANAHIRQRFHQRRAIDALARVFAHTAPREALHARVHAVR